MALDKKLESIKKYISLKNDTDTGDIILVGMPGGIYYGTVQDIKQDIKKNWYIVRFTLLVLPPVECSWKLRLPQMCGEIFTINGDEHFMAAVKLEPESKDKSAHEDNCTINSEKPGNVLHLQRKKNTDTPGL